MQPFPFSAGPKLHPGFRTNHFGLIDGVVCMSACVWVCVFKYDAHKTIYVYVYIYIHIHQKTRGLLWQASGWKTRPKTTRSYPRLAALWNSDGNARVSVKFRSSFVPSKGEPTAPHFWFLNFGTFEVLQFHPILNLVSHLRFQRASPSFSCCKTPSLRRITKICLGEAPTTPQGTHWTPCLWDV